MINFEYTRVSTVKAAIDTMVKHPGAKLIAGGTNLVDLMKKGVTFTQAGNAAHDLPWCTIAALKSVMLNKGFLQRMQLITICHAFYGSDFFPLLHYG